MTSQQPEQPSFSEPEHPDYALIEDVVIRMVDLVSQEPGFDPSGLLSQVADTESLGHVAMRRAIGYLGIQSPVDLQARSQEVMHLAMYWSEGFFVGAQTERTRD